MTEQGSINYEAVLRRVARPEDARGDPTLPMRRFVRAILRHKETPQFTATVVAFSNVAYLTESGIGRPEYHILQASRTAERVGLAYEEISRASEVAGNLWDEYRKLTAVVEEPVQTYQPLSPEATKAIQKRLKEQKIAANKKPPEDLSLRDSLTKHHLVELVAGVTGQTKKATEKTVDALLEQLLKQMLSGRKVVLQGFGTFQVTTRAEKKVLTAGVEKQVPSHKFPQFFPGKTLKRAIRNNG